MSKVYLTFEDMQNCPAADDVDSADIVLSADGCDGPMRWCPENQDWFPFKQFVLDLSPLQKFMGRRDLRMKRGEWVCCEGPEHHRICCAAKDHFSGEYITRSGFCDWQQVAEEGAPMRCRCGAPYFRNGALYVEGRGYAKPAQMYGMDYDFDWVPTAPSPEPEKSPQDKALDEFIAKRKAKRDCGGYHDQDAMDRLIAQDTKDAETERNLDRAMRRLSFHEQDIHTRLMPYRREEK